jgi:hypothetical protein
MAPKEKITAPRLHLSAPALPTRRRAPSDSVAYSLCSEKRGALRVCG